jgi:hypothetical protein
MKLSSAKLTLKKISVVLFAAFFGAAVVELALRLYSPRYLPVIVASYEYDAGLAFRLRPGAHLFRTTDYQQESITNGLGTANFQESFEGYESLVFAVGDSYTQGTGAPSDASYPAQLDLMLNRDAEGFYVKRFGVVNLGVAGYGGEQALLNLKGKAELLGAPSVILYLGCDNDFVDDLAFRSGERHGVLIPGSPVWGRMTTPLRVFTEHTQIGLRLRAALEERRRSGFAEAADPTARALPAAELQAPVLERLAAFAKERGSLLVVSWSGAGDSYEWLKGWAGRGGVAFADWAPKADSVRRVMPALTLDNQHSSGHHRAWVNGVIAEEFRRQMAARGF